MKIAQGLLLRKQLEKKVAQLEPIKQMGTQGLFEVKVQRINVTEQVDQVTMNIPKMTLAEVTAEYDKYATALRKLDSSLQQANWAFDLTFTDAENPFEQKTVPAPTPAPTV